MEQRQTAGQDDEAGRAATRPANGAAGVPDPAKGTTDAADGNTTDNLTDSLADTAPQGGETAETPEGPEAPTVARKTFCHADIGDRLIEECHARYIDGVMAVWNHEANAYELGHGALMRAMVRLWRRITASQRHEVESYLEIVAPRTEMGATEARLVGFSNCVLDIDTMRTVPNAPELLVTNLIPHRWDPYATCQDVDNAIGAWACMDRDRMDQICETVGLSVYRGRDVAQAPYIIGRGGNGKSVFLSVLANAVGEENVSRVDLASIGKRFQTVPLMGKLVNIADDATTSKALEGEGVAKNALSKNAVPYEIKGGATSSFRPWAQFVLSANDYPTLRRADAAMMRRLVFVSFEADFAGRAADTGLEGRLRTEEAASRLLYLGVCALRRLLARDGHLMTRTEDTARSEEELRKRTSSVYEFLREMGDDDACLREVVGRRTKDVYGRYKAFCESANRRPAAHNRFTSEVCETLRITSRRDRHASCDGTTKQAATFCLR